MSIAVLAHDDQWKEINTAGADVDYLRVDSIGNIPAGMDAYLFLQEDIVYDFDIAPQLVLINTVCVTLREIDAPENVVRINGWNSFLSRDTWEAAGAITDRVQQVFASMRKKVIRVPDEPGFISARVIAMITNEAYFALEDKVSTKEEIDIAMKLGTNYPYGPFEWSSLIGIPRIYQLLEKLSMHDKRYLPSTLLKAAATA